MVFCKPSRLLRLTVIMDSFIVETVVGFVQPLVRRAWRPDVFCQAPVAGGGFLQGLFGGELFVVGAAGDDRLG